MALCSFVVFPHSGEVLRQFARCRSFAKEDPITLFSRQRPSSMARMIQKATPAPLDPLSRLQTACKTFKAVKLSDPDDKKKQNGLITALSTLIKAFKDGDAAKLVAKVLPSLALVAKGDLARLLLASPDSKALLQVFVAYLDVLIGRMTKLYGPAGKQWLTDKVELGQAYVLAAHEWFMAILRCLDTLDSEDKAASERGERLKGGAACMFASVVSLMAESWHTHRPNRARQRALRLAHQHRKRCVRHWSTADCSRSRCALTSSSLSVQTNHKKVFFIFDESVAANEGNKDKLREGDLITAKDLANIINMGRGAYRLIHVSCNGRDGSQTTTFAGKPSACSSASPRARPTLSPNEASSQPLSYQTTTRTSSLLVLPTSDLASGKSKCAFTLLVGRR